MKKTYLTLMISGLLVGLAWVTSLIALQHVHPPQPNVDRFARYQQDPQLPNFYTPLSLPHPVVVPGYPTPDVSRPLFLAHNDIAKGIHEAKTLSLTDWQSILLDYTKNINTELDLSRKESEALDRERHFKEVAGYIIQEKKDLTYATQSAKLNSLEGRKLSEVINSTFEQLQNQLPAAFREDYPFIRFCPHNIVTQREYGTYKVDVYLSTSSATVKQIPFSTEVHFGSRSDIFEVPKPKDPSVSVQVYATKIGILPDEKPRFVLEKVNDVTYKATLLYFTLTQEEAFLNGLGSGWQSTLSSGKSPYQTTLQLTYWPYFLLKKCSTVFAALTIFIGALSILLFIFQALRRVKFPYKKWRSQLKKYGDHTFAFIHKVTGKIRFFAFLAVMVGIYFYVTQDANSLFVNPTLLVITWLIAIDGYRSKSKTTFVFPAVPLFFSVPILLSIYPSLHVYAERVVILVYFFLLTGFVARVYEFLFHKEGAHGLKMTARLFLRDSKSSVLFIIRCLLLFFQNVSKILRILHRSIFTVIAHLQNLKQRLMHIRKGLNSVLEMGLEKYINEKDKKSLFYKHAFLAQATKKCFFFLVKLVNLIILSIILIPDVAVKILKIISSALEKVIKGVELTIKFLTTMFWTILRITIMMAIRITFHLTFLALLIFPFVEATLEARFFVNYFFFTPYLAYGTHTLIYQGILLVTFIALSVRFWHSRHRKAFLFFLILLFDISQVKVFHITTDWMNSGPTITAIDPPEASFWREIRIYGHHFGENQRQLSTVYIGGVQHRVLRWHDDEIIFLTNPINSRTGDVQVTDGDEQKKSNTVHFTYNN